MPVTRTRGQIRSATDSLNELVRLTRLNNGILNSTGGTGTTNTLDYELISLVGLDDEGLDSLFIDSMTATDSSFNPSTGFNFSINGNNVDFNSPQTASGDSSDIYLIVGEDLSGMENITITFDAEYISGTISNLGTPTFSLVELDSGNNSVLNTYTVNTPYGVGLTSQEVILNFDNSSDNYSSFAIVLFNQFDSIDFRYANLQANVKGRVENITKYLLQRILIYNNNSLVGVEYRDIQGNLKNLRGEFIPYYPINDLEKLATENSILRLHSLLELIWNDTKNPTNVNEVFYTASSNTIQDSVSFYNSIASNIQPIEALIYNDSNANLYYLCRNNGGVVNNSYYSIKILPGELFIHSFPVNGFEFISENITGLSGDIKITLTYSLNVSI